MATRQCFRSRSFVALALIALALVGLAAFSCRDKGLPLAGSGSGSIGSMDTPQGKAQDRLPTAILRSGGISLEAELAITQDQQTAGLMFRTELADGQGMLFVYDRDRIMSFWMKNTLVPLSIAYLSADGTIREIFDMRPLSLEAITGTRHARYALEVPQGWFERVGLKPGDRFELPATF